MKYRKVLCGFAKWLCLIVLMIFVNLGIKIGMDGMWLWGIPKAEDVVSVTIKYPSLTDKDQEITDREDVERCVNMSGLLKYRLFANAEEKEKPLITFYYHLENGNQVEVSANETAVFYNGKKHILKENSIFVNCVEGIFYTEMFTE